MQELVILRKIVLLQIIEQLAAAACHLQEAAATVKVLAVGAQVLGQMIDASGEERNLDLGRTGVLVVGFVFGDDFWFYYGRHGLMIEFHDCRGF